MKSKRINVWPLVLNIFIIGLISCSENQSRTKNAHPDSDAAFKYLKELEGKWVVNGGDEGMFGWEFDLTSREGVIVEKLKVGTPTEMTTVYLLDHGKLVGNHYCQLQNQPKLSAIISEQVGDLHFLCDGSVGNTQSHDELHMHGVHFQKKDTSLLIWMDMHENGKLAFETKYELFRVK